MWSSCCTSAIWASCGAPAARRSLRTRPSSCMRPHASHVVSWMKTRRAARRLRVQVLAPPRLWRRVAPELPVQAEVAPPAVPPTSGTYAESPNGCECAVTASGAATTLAKSAACAREPARRRRACGSARRIARDDAVEAAPREEREHRVRRQPVLGAAEDRRLREEERPDGDGERTRKSRRSVSSAIARRPARRRRRRRAPAVLATPAHARPDAARRARRARRRRPRRARA